MENLHYALLESKQWKEQWGWGMGNRGWHWCDEQRWGAVQRRLSLQKISDGDYRHRLSISQILETLIVRDLTLLRLLLLLRGDISSVGGGVIVSTATTVVAVTSPVLAITVVVIPSTIIVGCRSSTAATASANGLSKVSQLRKIVDIAQLLLICTRRVNGICSVAHTEALEQRFIALRPWIWRQLRPYRATALGL